MKLRLATPAYLIDIDALAAELGYVDERAPGADGVVSSGSARWRATAQLLESDLLAARLADLHRRRAGDRRSGRAQPRHDRRCPVPGRPVRGPQRRLRGARRADGDPRSRRRARRDDGRVPPRPLPDRGRAGRDAGRDPDSAARRIGQRLREGRPPRRRLGGGRGWSRADRLDGGRDRDAVASRWSAVGAGRHLRRGRGRAGRARARRTSCSHAGRAARRGVLLAGLRSARIGGVQAPRRRRARLASAAASSRARRGGPA